ncbi:MAG TPA: type II secretion system protein [Candidatus Saccharimonadales bacterium]|jgi:prepilin-type N-terminal cleavage/methylation domain-containing protein|nr:type II secretion system protein [Candidatus Saccharimonadales bacterium]
MHTRKARPGRRKPAGHRGFTLVELLVAMAVFLVISGAAVSLVRAHIPLVSSQQNQAGLNMAMRNAVAQMQIDAVNAGTGYYQGVNIPAWPIGITIANSAPGADCYNAATFTYGAGCFDTLNIIVTDESTPPSTPSGNGANCVSTTASTLFTSPVGATTLAQLAASFHAGDQLLLVKSDGSQMTTTILTKDGSVTGGKVQLQHNPTGTGGTNTSVTDPLLITQSGDANKLGEQFCTGDWVLKLSPITYSVDSTDNTNPKLVRKQAGVSTVISEQIIGFKAGASIWNGATDAAYNFDSSSYGYDFALVRAVRVSVIGRTTADWVNQQRNTFDQGPYRVEAVSVVINPRNLSMNQ